MSLAVIVLEQHRLNAVRLNIFQQLLEEYPNLERPRQVFPRFHLDAETDEQCKTLFR